MNFEGENISLKDALFVDNITGDIESFRIRSDSIARVLIFPPVSNYHRFLIHKVVETGFPQFTTFSVGEGIHRRTVIAFQLHLLNQISNQANNSRETSEEPSQNNLLTQDKEESPNTENINEDTDRIALVKLDGDNSSATELKNNPSTFDNNDKDSTESEISSEDYCATNLEHINSDTTTSDATSTTQDSISDNCTDMTAENEISDSDKSLSAKEQANNAEAIRRKAKRPAQAVYVPPRGRLTTNISNPTSPTSQESPTKLKKEVIKTSTRKSSQSISTKECELSSDKTSSKNISAEDNEEKENTLDVTNQIVSEITEAVGGVQIEEPLVDYLSFQTSDSSINIDQFGHVIELYNFPATYKTTDLVNAFQAFTSRWDIKWVDDTHALGVFSSSDVAAEALAVRHPIISTRPLNMATPQSKIKAQVLLEELLPYKPRPVSCTGPARRLLQRALGSSMRVPEASKVENDRLKEAQRRKEEERRREGVEEERKKRREGTEERGRGDKKYRFGQHDDR